MLNHKVRRTAHKFLHKQLRASARTEALCQNTHVADIVAYKRHRIVCQQRDQEPARLIPYPLSGFESNGLHIMVEHVQVESCMVVAFRSDGTDLAGSVAIVYEDAEAFLDLSPHRICEGFLRGDDRPEWIIRLEASFLQEAGKKINRTRVGQDVVRLEAGEPLMKPLHLAGAHVERVVAVFVIQVRGQPRLGAREATTVLRRTPEQGAPGAEVPSLHPVTDKRRRQGFRQEVSVLQEIDRITC